MYACVAASAAKCCQVLPTHRGYARALIMLDSDAKPSVENRLGSYASSHISLSFSKMLCKKIGMIATVLAIFSLVSFGSSAAETTGKKMANTERTFIMVKPDAVQRGLVGKIIERFEQKGFKLVAMKFMWASKDLLEKHYSDLSGRPFFAGLVDYMSSGPVVPMVWEGLNVVKTGRQMLGATNPADSLPGTIRGDFCIQVGRNILHGSDAVESANKEIALWFNEKELVDWKPATANWVYE